MAKGLEVAPACFSCTRHRTLKTPEGTIALCDVAGHIRLGGSLTYPSAAWMRSSGGDCGPSGKMFQGTLSQTKDPGMISRAVAWFR